MARVYPARLVRYCVYCSMALFMLGMGYSLLYTGAKHTDGVSEHAHRRRSACREQPVLEYIARFLAVRYEVLDHVDYKTKGALRFHNAGIQTVSRGNWSVFLFYMSPIDTDLLNYGSGISPPFRIARLQGNLYRLSPTAFFRDLLPGQDIELHVVSGTTMLTYTDLLPNWYVTAKRCEPVILEATREAGDKHPDFVEPFSPLAARRAEMDPILPYTPETRYAKQHVPDLGSAPHLVLPTPLEVKYKGAHTHAHDVTSEWKILHMPHLASEASYLSSKLHVDVTDARPSDKYIQLTIGAVPFEESSKHKDNPEAYYVDVNSGEEKITICGQSAAGVFYGVQTLLSLVRQDATGKQSVLVLRVQDAPRFPYRGLMVDLSRNFHTLDELKTLIEGLALVKVNKLHLHLADDEGWRLEIPGLPELTQIGARRCHDPAEKHCILPALGSGPHNTTSGSGYLSVSEYKTLLQFAQRRHVEIIPEFDMPGHGRAAIKSMEARYVRKMKEHNPKEARRYLLSDPHDASVYMSGQYFTDNAINPCIESTYDFVEHLITSLQRLHEEIQPLKRFHFGGDEVPENAFMESPECKTYMRAHPELSDTRDLKIHFIKRIGALAAKHNIGLQGWEDAFYGKQVQPLSPEDLQSKDVLTNVWWNMWEAGIGHRANELANANYKVVLSHSTHFYFDHVQEPDPDERGLYWAMRYIDTRRVFNYVADDIYENIDLRGWGDPWNRQDACSGTVNCMPLNKPHNVMGLQGQVWGETVRSKNHLDLMVFPRMVALAERAWHKAPWEDLPDARRRQERWKDWIQFANSLGYKLLPALQGLGINYYLPPPGVIKSEGVLRAAAMFPGLPVVYKEQGASDWALWTDGTTITKPTLFATRSHDGRRMSRPIQVSPGVPKMNGQEIRGKAEGVISDRDPQQPPLTTSSAPRLRAPVLKA